MIDVNSVDLHNSFLLVERTKKRGKLTNKFIGNRNRRTKLLRRARIFNSLMDAKYTKNNLERLGKFLCSIEPLKKFYTLSYECVYYSYNYKIMVRGTLVPLATTSKVVSAKEALLTFLNNFDKNIYEESYKEKIKELEDKLKYITNIPNIISTSLNDESFMSQFEDSSMASLLFSNGEV